MENEILERVKKNEETLGKVLVSVEKTRKYLFWTFVVTLIVVVLPLIGLVLAVPQFMNQMNEAQNIGGLGGL